MKSTLNPQERRVLETMLENLTPETWMKGSNYDPATNRRCLNGHLALASTSDAIPDPYYGAREALVETLLSRDRPLGIGGLITFKRRRQHHGRRRSPTHPGGTQVKSSEILGQLLDVVTEETWFQGALFNHASTRACLIGHVSRVVGHTTVGKVRGYENVIQALNLAIFTRYLNRVTGPGSTKSPIARFNDHPDTTIEDVHLVIKDAYVEALDA
jgi:hypothetical protein